MKLNWGHGLAIALAIFAAIMLGFLYNSFQLDHEMVADNYYQEELVFQDKIDQKTNAKAAGKSISIKEEANQVIVQFTVDDTALTEGEIEFMRPSNQKLDVQFPIVLNERAQLAISKEHFARGKYTVRASWKVNDVDYYITKNIFIQ